MAGLGAAFLTLALAAPAGATTPELTTTPMAEADRAQIDAGIAAIMAQHPEVPAIYIGVWDPARGAYEQAYGLADVAGGRAASLEDHFRIGSISKTFGAAIILQLVAEGKLALDDTVTDADPALAERFPAIAQITIKDLVAMTSGIPDYMNVKDAAVARVAVEPQTQWDPLELIGYGIDKGLAPAGTPGYSTTNYIILQVIAEAITGQPIQELVKERLTDPLGMTETALPYNADTTLPDPAAHGYLSPSCVEELVRDGAEPVPADTDTTDWNASYGQIGGGMHSTVADLGVWAASMSGNSLLPADLAAARLETNDAVAPPTKYGMGIIRFGNQVGHEGEAIGWEGWAGHDPDTGLTAVVMTTTCSDSGVVFGTLAALDPAFAATLAAGG